MKYLFCLIIRYPITIYSLIGTVMAVLSWRMDYEYDDHSLPAFILNWVTYLFCVVHLIVGSMLYVMSGGMEGAPWVDAVVGILALLVSFALDRRFFAKRQKKQEERQSD